MDRVLRDRILRGAAALVMSAGLVACGSAAPAENTAAADEVTAAWVKAFNAGDAAAVGALYTEEAHSMPPGGGPVTGRTSIEAYWREDMGSGGIVTTLTPNDSVMQGDLLHVDGTYEVKAKDGLSLAKGQYQQLWDHADNQWKVQHEVWRLDPSFQHDPKASEQLASQWTTAYNAGDAEGLMALYADDAELSTHPAGSIQGRKAIGGFWKDDFGGGKPSTTLTLTDAYMAGGLAHLEGQYEVADKGTVTRGHYVQLWMQDGDAWRIHREMWWQQ